MREKRTRWNAPISKELRLAIQQSELNITQTAKRYEVSEKTASFWKKQSTVEDRKKGPKTRGFRVLTAQEEKMIVTLRRNELLPLDSCLFRLQKIIPHLTRTTLYRCFQRNRLNDLDILKSSFTQRFEWFKDHTPKCITPFNTGTSVTMRTSHGIDLLTGKLRGTRPCYFLSDN
jgi:hypothetical protein